MAAEPPDGLDLERHRDLSGRAHGPRVRLVAQASLFILPVLALLNVFGQAAEETVARGQGAQLALNAPAALRGGLVFETSFLIRAEQGIESPRLVLSPDWLRGFTLNTTEPAAADEVNVDGSTAFNYPEVPPGQALRVVFHWQVNPTTVGTRRLSVQLKDGDRTITTIRRDLRVFP